MKKIYKGATSLETKVAPQTIQRPNNHKNETRRGFQMSMNRNRVIGFLTTLGLFLSVLGATGFSPARAADGDATIVVHYNRAAADYTDWNMWVWFPGITAEEGVTHGLAQSRNDFNGTDSYGKTLTMHFTNMTDITKIGFIVRKDDWTKDVGSDRWITNFDSNGKAEIWLREGITKVYDSLPCLCAEVYGATQDDYRTVNVTLSEPFRGVGTTPQGWTISGGLNVVSIAPGKAGKTIRTTPVVTLTLDADMEIGGNYTVSNSRPVEVIKKSLTANVVTLTTAADTAFMVGQTVRIKDLGAPFDGVAKLTGASTSVAGAWNFTYARTSANVPAASVSGVVDSGYGSGPVSIGKIYNSQRFADLFTYSGDDLGNTYSLAKTDFRVWAPTASSMKLVTFGNEFGSVTTEGIETDMTADVNGTWIASLPGDQHGTVYVYRATIGGVVRDSIDPYARSAVPNGRKGVVVDLAKTNPVGWNNVRPAFSGRASDASVYEVHVRDLSMDPNSGIPAAHKGKYLAFTDTKTSYSTKVGKVTVKTNTGLAAIKELGVTHVELQPVYDFTSVDELSTTNTQFNWGYDPQNFNVPEGSYSTDPANPVKRIMELKAAIQAMHNNGLRVNMDVVYPHVGSATEFSQELLVPGYFYRTDATGALANGSGCGNEIASERTMARKFMTDSAKYWTAEYHMDGFRFDQMGLIDITTMQGIRAALTAIDPTTLIFGEGWDIGDVLPSSQKTRQGNLISLPGIGAFNDQMRDGIKGSGDGTSRGWLGGYFDQSSEVKAGVVGSIDYGGDIYPNWNSFVPGQSVNYVESHDNLTFYDKLRASSPDSAANDAARVRLAGASIILAQGMPFQQAGQEFLRSKGGNANSYNADDSVNALKWKSRIDNATTVKYYAGLYSIRKAHPAFRMATSASVKSNLKFLKTVPEVVAYSLKGSAVKDTWKSIVVMHNASTATITVALPSRADWTVYIKGSVASKTALSVLKKTIKVSVPALSTMVVAK